MIGLAVSTGIAPSVWVDEGARAIVTASKILEEQEKAANKNNPQSASPEPGGSYSGVQLSG